MLLRVAASVIVGELEPLQRLLAVIVVVICLSRSVRAESLIMIIMVITTHLLMAGQLHQN